MLLLVVLLKGSNCHSLDNQDSNCHRLDLSLRINITVSFMLIANAAVFIIHLPPAGFIVTDVDVGPRPASFLALTCS